MLWFKFPASFYRIQAHCRVEQNVSDRQLNNMISRILSTPKSRGSDIDRPEKVANKEANALEHCCNIFNEL